MAGRINVPVEIPAESIEDFFTVSSWRVSRAFAAAELETQAEMGGGYTPHSLAHFVSFMRAQVNEADAHGIGTSPWVMEMVGSIDRVSAALEEGIVTPEEWADQLSAFGGYLHRALASRGLRGATDLPNDQN